MKPEDVEDFLRNLRDYIRARRKNDYDIANIINGRLRAFLERDILAAKDETPADNPFTKMFVAMGGPDALAGALPKMLNELQTHLKAEVAKCDKLLDLLQRHWSKVRGTDAGDKLPMINFIRETVKRLGLEDIGIVKTREFVEHQGCYNGAPQEMEVDGDGWKGSDE